MGKITLTESDQALLCMLSAKQAGAVLHRLLGKDGKLDAAGEGAYRAITEGEESRKAARERKRKSRALHCDRHVTATGMSQEKHCDSHVTVTDLSQDSHKTAPPFLPPSSSPPTPPVSPPPYNPPTNKKNTGTNASVGQSVGQAVGLFLDRVDPLASPYRLERLCAYVRDMGDELVHRVICYALDEKKGSWNYITAVLQDCKKSGIDSVEAWNNREENWERRKQHGTAASRDASGGAKDGTRDAGKVWAIRGTVVAGD